MVHSKSIFYLLEALKLPYNNPIHISIYSSMAVGAKLGRSLEQLRHAS